MIKISFSGFSGSGKTSLMTEVKKILSLKSRVETIEELKGKNPFDSDKKSCFVSQFFFVSTQINEENRKALAPLDYLLCDQSVLDQWIYWNRYLADKEMTSQLEEKNNLLKALYQFWIKTYDLIFLIRMDLNELEKRDIANEIRITDVEHIKKIEELYKKSIQEDNLKVIEIWNNNTIDESALEIIREISEYTEREREKEKEQLQETDAGV
ncbi:MAG: AAA family ATPase [Candidatus Aminicenantes bacterium]|nr:AAA family ATPase [Candidatus Aminicenantes bacterium]NIM81692.1 AAA family ATPase [Candidatus Aminicenantes bacterium]NIN21063.1 AAA family ATPase [Candidatus Aminicenantes bacterium]NIN44885.1 AAA family ATPase [Candidatus Aminicenantes bacterium]NIN87699.1 AAA family ATPase [Candidatus Aminicenantes bacterium]